MNGNGPLIASENCNTLSVPQTMAYLRERSSQATDRAIQTVCDDGDWRPQNGEAGRQRL